MFLTFDENGLLKFWSLTTFKPIKEISSKFSKIKSFALTNDFKYIFTGD